MAISDVTCKQYLAEARAAYHGLMIGRNVMLVTDQNGERVQFTQANKTDLLTYIRQLEAQCGDCSGGDNGCGGNGITNGPLQFTF